MHQATQMIVRQFPIIKKHLNSEKISVQLTDTELIFTKLVDFLEHPKTNHFDLSEFNKLAQDWLEFALDILNVYFYKNMYSDYSEKRHHAYLVDDLVNQTEFVRMLIQSGIDYTQSKFSVYYSRGIVPR
jgi:hypothetical protein